MPQVLQARLQPRTCSPAPEFQRQRVIRMPADYAVPISHLNRAARCTRHDRQAQLGPDGRCAGAQALTYFCIYVVRQGVTSWFVFYLMKVGHPGMRGAQRPPGTAGSNAGAASAISTAGCRLKTQLLGTCAGCSHSPPP